jgi:hypothetical protein
MSRRLFCVHMYVQITRLAKTKVTQRERDNIYIYTYVFYTIHDADF